MIKWSISILVLFIGVESYAQEYIAGYVEYQDGKTEEGFILPFLSDAKKIKFKKELSDKETKLKSKDLYEIGFFFEEDTIVFKNYYRGRYKGFGTRVRKFDGDCWAYKIYHSEALEAFLYTDKRSANNFPSIMFSSFGAWATNSPFIVNLVTNSERLGFRFPDDDTIIDVGFPENKSQLSQNAYKRKIRKYLERNCWRFLKANRDKSVHMGEDLYEYLDFYTKTCSSE